MKFLKLIKKASYDVSELQKTVTFLKLDLEKMANGFQKSGDDTWWLETISG